MQCNHKTEIESLPKRSFYLFLKTGAYLFLPLFLILSTLQCSIKKPTAPSWNTKLTIPLTSKHYDMPTLIEKINDPNLRLDSLGNPCFYSEEELDTVRIRKNLSLSPISENLSETLGPVQLNSSKTLDNTIDLVDIYPWGAGFLPDTALAFAAEAESIDFFTQATIQSGTATLVLENQLGLDLDSIVVEVVDSFTSTVVATFVFPNGVLDTQTDTQTTILTDEIAIHNQFYYNIYTHTPGDTVFTTSNKYMRLELSIDDFTVSQATARIPSISVEKNEILTLAPSGVTIDSANIRSGSISLNLNNFSNLDADIEIKLPDFIKAGQVLTINRAIAGDQAANVNIPLDGYDFIPQVSQALRVEISALTESSGTELVAFNSSDSIKLDASTSEIAFSRVSGTIPQAEVEIGPMQKKLKLPKGFENTQLTNALLELTISNGTNLPINLSIKLCGDNGKELDLNGLAESGSATSPSQTTIVDSNSSQFFDPIPSNITITGTAICGQETNRATITENDFVFAKMKTTSPLQFVMEPSDVQIESTSSELTDDVQDLLIHNLNWGKVVLNTTNHLPFGASIELYISANQEDLFINPDLTVGPICLTSGIVGADGLVEESAVSNNVIELGSEDIEVFKNRPFYIGGNLHLSGTDGKEVKVVGSDYLDVTAYLELEIKNGD